MRENRMRRALKVVVKVVFPFKSILHTKEPEFTYRPFFKFTKSQTTKGANEMEIKFDINALQHYDFGKSLVFQGTAPLHSS